MNRIMTILLSSAWYMVVFSGVLWLTFPSEAVAQFVHRVVGNSGGGQYSIRLGSTSPRWFGLAASDVLLSSTDAESPRILLDASSASVRLHPLALLRRVRQVSGWAAIGDGEVSVRVAAADDEGTLRTRRLEVEGDDVSLMALVDAASGTRPIDGSGSVDVAVDLKMPEGLGKADGTVEIIGNDLRVTQVNAPAWGLTNQALDLAISELDIKLTAAAGILAIDRFSLRSSLLQVTATGEISLDDKWDRSRIRADLEVELGDWTDTPLSAFRQMAESFMASAKWSDGRYHYSTSATLGRFGFNDFKPERDRNSRTRPPGPAAAGAAEPIAEPPAAPVPVTPPPTKPAERPEPAPAPAVLDDEPDVGEEGEGPADDAEGDPEAVPQEE